MSTPTQTNNTVELHAAIENSLSTALHLVRTGRSVADLQRATARAVRAATLLKKICETTQFQIGGAV